MPPRGCLEFTANFVAADNFIVLEIRDAGESEKKEGCALLAANSDSNRRESRSNSG